LGRDRKRRGHGIISSGGPHETNAAITPDAAANHGSNLSVILIRKKCCCLYVKESIYTFFLNLDENIQKYLK